MGNSRNLIGFYCGAFCQGILPNVRGQRKSGERRRRNEYMPFIIKLKTNN